MTAEDTTTRIVGRMVRIGTFPNIVISMVVFICSCGEHRIRSLPASITGMPLHLMIRTMVAGVDFSYDSVYHTAANRAYSVTDFRYYISRVKAIRNDGTEENLSDAVILVDPRIREYDLGLLSAGSYKGLQFTVGLDSTTNHSDPTVYAAGHPLAMQTPSMHWNWNSGYLFMKIEGRVDTTANGTLSPATEFFYHFGLDTMKREIRLPVVFTIDKAQVNFIRLKFDLDSVFAAVDMRSEIKTHSFDDLPLASRMADRWQVSLSIDK